jgi:hypothetical protein
MTPQEKAKQLVDKFYSKGDKEGLLVNRYWINAKFCALIAVDEILDSRRKHLVQSINFYEYWQEVKQEILKL